MSGQSSYASPSSDQSGSSSRVQRLTFHSTRIARFTAQPPCLAMWQRKCSRFCGRSTGFSWELLRIRFRSMPGTDRERNTSTMAVPGSLQPDHSARRRNCSNPSDSWLSVRKRNMAQPSSGSSGLLSSSAVHSRLFTVLQPMLRMLSSKATQLGSSTDRRNSGMSSRSSSACWVFR